jgi:hypothetical protein
VFDYLAGDRRRLRRGIRATAREVAVGEARVFLDHGFQWDGVENVWLTRARASFAMQAGPIFDVRPRGTLARVVGWQGGVSSGDPCFDYFFAVRTPAADETWRALTTRVRSLLAGSFDDARLVSDGRMITFWREGDFGREADAALAIEIVSEIAHHRIETLEALRRLPGAAYRGAAGPWDRRAAPGVEVPAAVPVRIEPAAHRGRAVMTARASCGRAAGRFAIAFDDEPVQGDVGLAPRMVEAAYDVGASGLSGDAGVVTLRWPELETSRELLLGGAELVGRIAAEPIAGVYR